jgi:hypothetical protein
MFATPPCHSRRRLLSGFGASAMLAAAGLSGCGSKTQVPFGQQVNFGQGINDPQPLHQTPQAIANVLKQGGLAIYLRHGRTQYDQLELERNNRRNGTLDLANCNTQRQLSAEGRAEMATTGQQFRAAGLALDLRWSSRYCRAIESAKFFVDDAQPTELLSGEGEVGLNPANRDRTRRVFSQLPTAGKNNFYMAHGGIFWEATGFTIQEAHTVILDPRNLSVIVARIAPAQWGAVAQFMPR